MKTKPHSWALTLWLLLGAGCAAPFFPEPDLAPVQVTVVHSAQVAVDGAWLIRGADGIVRLQGLVIRRVGAADTAKVHLDVALFDASGREVGHARGSFSPAQLPVRRKLRGHGEFELPLTDFPRAVTKIEVRAHEADPEH